MDILEVEKNTALRQNMESFLILGFSRLRSEDCSIIDNPNIYQRDQRVNKSSGVFLSPVWSSTAERIARCAKPRPGLGDRS